MPTSTVRCQTAPHHWDAIRWALINPRNPRNPETPQPPPASPLPKASYSAYVPCAPADSRDQGPTREQEPSGGQEPTHVVLAALLAAHSVHACDCQGFEQNGPKRALPSWQGCAVPSWTRNALSMLPSALNPKPEEMRTSGNYLRVTCFHCCRPQRPMPSSAHGSATTGASTGCRSSSATTAPSPACRSSWPQSTSLRSWGTTARSWALPVAAAAAGARAASTLWHPSPRVLGAVADHSWRPLPGFLRSPEATHLGYRNPEPFSPCPFAAGRKASSATSLLYLSPKPLD